MRSLPILIKKIRTELLRKSCSVSHMTHNSICSVIRSVSHSQFQLKKNKAYACYESQSLAVLLIPINIGLLSNGEECFFSDKSTFQQFVVQKRHNRRPNGKHFDGKLTILTVKHTPTQMVWGYVQKWCRCSQFLASRNHYEWGAQIRAYALKEAKTSHARSPTSNIYAGWRPLSPFQCCKDLSG